MLLHVSFVVGGKGGEESLEAFVLDEPSHALVDDVVARASLVRDVLVALISSREEDGGVESCSEFLQAKGPIDLDAARVALANNAPARSLQGPQLWLGKRPFETGSKLSARLGSNEKTKVRVALRGKDSGVPDAPSSAKSFDDVKINDERARRSSRCGSGRRTLPLPPLVDDDVREEWKVPEEKLRALLRGDVHRQFRDPALKRLLETVVSARDPRAALQQHIESNADFASFANDVLVAVGAASFQGNGVLMK